MSNRKKLIEVALPLEAINRESAHEKSVPRKGHPATMHLWWARRPLVACRAVLFASLVDDPSSHPDKFPTQESQEAERQRLFGLIEELVKWENSSNEQVLRAARDEILRSTEGHPPPVVDPFCGGGSIPIEAQRLRLEAHASDLNPIAVLITKALIEIPSKFAGRPPINPENRKKLDHSKSWHRAEGLAEDVRHYGKWMRDEAEKRIGHLYPKIKLPKERGVGEATVIAWFWARTVKCPNPACGAQMPLIRSFWLSTKKGSEAWIEPIVDRQAKTVRFEIRTGVGKPVDPPKIGRGAKFRCLICAQAAGDRHIKEEGFAARMMTQMMAIVADSGHGRAYLAATPHQLEAARSEQPHWAPTEQLADDPRNIWCLGYGLSTFDKLFTSRQLVALTTLSDLVAEMRQRVVADARTAGLFDDGKSLNDGGTGSTAYGDAVATYLSFAIDKLADWSSSICSWIHSIQGVRDTFARQAIPMVWDFVEINPFSDSVGNFWNHVQWTADGLRGVPASLPFGIARQLDATAAINGVTSPLICTDPPYYDNISYADLSDFFYVWLRRSLGKIYPDLFSTLLTPKTQELIASPYRFKGIKEEAEKFFERGLGEAFARMRAAQNPDFPMTLFYAFKQTEAEADEDENGNAISTVASTGWETMLEGLLKSGFAITGTWPMRSERGARSIAVGTNALASSIVLVCRPKSDNAALATRREFLNTLKVELPAALKNLKQGNIAPVDLAQAAIGPGMAVFSQYSRVLEADGTPMTVRTALSLINQVLDEVLAEQESEFDPETRWALAWFEQFGMDEASFGVAETLSKAKNTAVNGLVDAGILAAKGGKVRLLRRSEMSPQWDPATDQRVTIWEVAQHLIRALEQDGEAGAASLLRKLGSLGDVARDLAYRLFSLCERNKWAQEALAYNSLVIAWPEIARLAKTDKPREQQAKLSL